MVSCVKEEKEAGGVSFPADVCAIFGIICGAVKEQVKRGGMDVP
jgi:hypothetical protein